jgi:DNA-binding PucR family transcriptional regulator
VDKPPLVGDVEVTRHVAEVARRLHDRQDEVSSAVRRFIVDHIAELRGDARIMDLLGASVEANVATILHALRYDIAVERVEAPTVALEYARRLAQHGVPVNALVRAYRLGQRRFNELVFAEVRTLDIDDPMGYAVLEAIAIMMFQYIDWISQQVVTVYEAERDRWLENQNSLRALRVREVLAADQAVDVDAAATSIRYPLRWHHVALVIWYPDVDTQTDRLAQLQRFLRGVGEVAGAAASPLFVAVDRNCAWAWLSYRAAAAPDGEADLVSKVRRFALARPDWPSAAIGTMARGVEGFRRSHREAEAAHRVAMLGDRPQPTVIVVTDPGVSLVARLGGDVADIRTWVASVLGDLAADNDDDARLRETLRTYLGCGSNYKLAAEGLNLHFNSVKYRLRRAIARRGRDIGGDRLDVELALLACHWYGAAVLQPAAR